MQVLLPTLRKTAWEANAMIVMCIKQKQHGSDGGYQQCNDVRQTLISKWTLEKSRQRLPFEAYELNFLVISKRLPPHKAQSNSPGFMHEFSHTSSK